MAAYSAWQNRLACPARHRVMFSSQPGDLCAQVLELVKLIPDLSAQLLDLRKRHINDFVKPNEQNSSSLEYSAMARIFVQASAIELAHIAERNRKCQKKIALLRTFSYPKLQQIIKKRTIGCFKLAFFCPFKIKAYLCPRNQILKVQQKGFRTRSPRNSFGFFIASSYTQITNKHPIF